MHHHCDDNGGILRFEGAEPGAAIRALIEQLKRAGQEADEKLQGLLNLRVEVQQRDPGSGATASVRQDEGGLTLILGIPEGQMGRALRFEDLTPAQMEALKGEPGTPGRAFTYSDFTTAQLAALKGEPGTPGRAFTYSDFTPAQLEALKGKQGDPGAPGEDGSSPTITVETISGGHRVTITDKYGEHEFNVMDGKGGGGGGSFSTTYVPKNENSDLNDFKVTGLYYLEGKASGYSIKNTPNGANNGWLEVIDGTTGGTVRAKQLFYRQGTNNTNDWDTWTRTYSTGAWSAWHRLTSPIHFDSFQYVYVDGVNGNDSNPGTNGSPFKTMDKAFQMLNNGAINLVIRVKTAGAYTISQSYITSATVHISKASASVGTVSIANTGSNDFVFYNSHINFSGVTLIPASGVFYAENCVTSFTDVKIEGTFTAFGGKVFIHDSEAQNWGLDGTSGNIEACKATRTGPYATSRTNDIATSSDGFFFTHGCVICIKRSIEFATLSAQGASSAAIRVEGGSIVTILTAPNQIATKYGYGIRALNGNVIATDDIKSAYAEVGVAAFETSGATIDALIDSGVIHKIPSALPNPNALTFTGAVTGSYDGSSPLSIEIPQGGESGGGTDYEFIDLIEIAEDGVASVDVDLHGAYKQLYLSVLKPGDDGNAYQRISVRGWNSGGVVKVDILSELGSNILDMALNSKIGMNANRLYTVRIDASTQIVEAVFDQQLLSGGAQGGSSNEFSYAVYPKYIDAFVNKIRLTTASTNTFNNGLKLYVYGRR